jgi:hypothetical protein
MDTPRRGVFAKNLSQNDTGAAGLASLIRRSGLLRKRGLDDVEYLLIRDADPAGDHAELAGPQSPLRLDLGQRRGRAGERLPADMRIVSRHCRRLMADQGLHNRIRNAGVLKRRDRSMTQRME